MKKPGMAAVLMAVALFTYAVVARAQTADPAGGGAAGGGTAAAGQAQQDESAMQAGSQQGQNPEEMQKKFIKDSLSGNQFEIEAGQLAAERAQRPEVKEFARTLAEHHQQANDELKQIAQQMGVETSQQLKPVHRAELDELKQLQGQAFDRAFVYTQLGDHQKEILCYRDISHEAQDQQLKQYAQQTLPKLQQHLEQAMSLAGVNQAGTASDIQRPDGSAGTGANTDGGGQGGQGTGQMDHGTQGGQTGQGQQ